MYLKDIVL